MQGDDTLDRAQRRAAAAPYQDGILELFAAVMFVAIGLIWAVGSGALIPILVAPLVLIGGTGLAWAKRRISEPRIGYAEGRTPADDSPWNGIVFIVLGIVVMLVAVAVTGGLGDVEAWRRWAPFLGGYLCSGGFWYLADVSGLTRYRFIAVISIVLGLIVSFASSGESYQPVSYYAFGMAALLAAVGLGLLVRFLMDHPRRDNTDRDGV